MEHKAVLTHASGALSVRERIMPTDRELNAAAKAMMRDITKRRGCNHGCLLLFEPKWPENVCVRGHLDLNSLAEAALKAAERVRQPRAKRSTST